MLLPPEWRLLTSPGFDAELTVAEEGARTEVILRGWRFYLSRDPIRFSWGLMGDDDEARLIATVDPADGFEYFAGLWVDRRRQAVYLTWVQRREAD